MVLSSYSKKPTAPPQPLTHGINFLHEGLVTVWAVGTQGWLRQLHQAEVQQLRARLGGGTLPAKMAQRMLTEVMVAEVEQDGVWVGGGSPIGLPIGVAVQGHRIRLPENKDYLRFGWLSPDGKAFYPCSYYEHDFLAEALDPDDNVSGLEMMNWLRISDGDPVSAGYDSIDPTDGQAEWLLDPHPTIFGG